MIAFTKNGGGYFIIRLSLIIFLFHAPNIFAENIYVNVDRGLGDACSESESCSLSQASTNASADNSIYILIQPSGDVFTIDGDYSPLDSAVNFAAYTRSSSEATLAILPFPGEFEVSEDGKFLAHSRTTAQFANFVIGDGNSYPFGQDSDDLGSVVVSALKAGLVTIRWLNVKSDFTIKRLGATTSSPVVTLEELEITKGATLSIGMEENEDGSDGENPAHLLVPLRQGAAEEDKYDNLIVHGVIDGAGSLLIAHDNSDTGRDDSDFNLHVTAGYTPTGDYLTFDHTDCVTTERGGEIRTDLHTIAGGNICISLKKMGRLVVIESIHSDSYVAGLICASSRIDPVVASLI